MMVVFSQQIFRWRHNHILLICYKVRIDTQMFFCNAKRDHTKFSYTTIGYGLLDDVTTPNGEVSKAALNIRVRFIEVKIKSMSQNDL